MQKKSQVTIFVILGIIIIFILALIFSLKYDILSNYFEQKNTNVPEQIIPIDNFVKNCIKETSYDALYLIGKQGGYFIVPKLATETNIPYYLYQNKDYIPSREVVQSQISSYLNEELFFCTKSFVDFPAFQVAQKDVSTNSMINNNEVIININYPINIKKGELTFNLKEFNNIKLPIRLGVIYNVTNEIEKLNDKNSICISCIVALGIQNDLNIELIHYKNDEVIFYIKDNKSIIYNNPYEFRFINKYQVI